jgi:hypothetical protein
VDGDGLQIWRAAANILKKQLQREKGWFSNLGVGWGTNTSSSQKTSMLYNVTQGLRHVLHKHETWYLIKGKNAD